MALNQYLLPLAASASTALVTVPWLAKPWPADCHRALQHQLPVLIEKHCGPDFSNIDLLLVIGLGGVVFVVGTFWKDLALFVHSKFEGQKK